MDIDVTKIAKHKVNLIIEYEFLIYFKNVTGVSN